MSKRLLVVLAASVLLALPASAAAAADPACTVFGTRIVMSGSSYPATLKTRSRSMPTRSSAGARVMT